MPAINSLDRQSAIALAQRMRSKARNAGLARVKMLEHGSRFAGAGLGSLALGYFMAGKEQEYLENAAAIEAGEMPDPRQLLGMDLELWIAAGFGAAGLVAQGVIGKGKANVGTGIGAGAEGVGIGALSSWMFNFGLERAQKADEEEDLAA